MKSKKTFARENFFFAIDHPLINGEKNFILVNSSKINNNKHITLSQRVCTTVVYLLLTIAKILIIVNGYSQ